MKEWIEKHYKICIIIAFLLSPVIVAFCVSSYWLPWPEIESHNDWIGFWGSYLGTIIGGAITLIVLWRTIESNKKEREAEEKREFFNKLLEDATYLDMLPKRIMRFLLYQDWNQYYSDLIEYNRKALEIQLRIEIEKEKNIYNGTEELIKKLEDNLKATDSLLEKQDLKNDEEIKKFMQQAELVKWTREAIIYEVKRFIIQNQENQ